MKRTYHRGNSCHCSEESEEGAQLFMRASQIYRPRTGLFLEHGCSEQHGQSEGYLLSAPESPSKRECNPVSIA